MGKITDAVKHLIIINVIFFVASMTIGEVVMEKMALFYPKNPHFNYWQFLTHMFMHGGVMHILFNMYALWAFGSPLEAMWGSKKFLFFYLATGLGAGIIYTLVNYYQFNSIYENLLTTGLSSDDIQNILETGKYNTTIESSVPRDKLAVFYQIFHTPAVGASGAIYGILVAFAFKYPDAELMLIFLPVPIKAKYFIPAVVALDLFSGLTGFSIFGSSSGGGIAHFAHVGGALIGYLLMLYFQKSQFKRWN
jgi:membrane associated rhomboid family serine protease